jgi:hypothetical protein
MRWQALSVLSLKSQQDAGEQQQVPPSWRFVVGSIYDSFYPYFPFQTTAFSVWRSRFVRSLVLYDGDGGCVEDA